MSALPLTSSRMVKADPALVINTARLVLRPHRIEDAEAIALSCGDHQVNRMLTRVPMPYHRQDALEWLLLQTANRLRDRVFAITTDGEAHIGIVTLEMRHGRWHLGYWLNRDHWGHGYMSEAVLAVLGSFFATMPDTTVYSGVFADNPASLKIQQKAGFIITGCSDVFSLSRNTMVPHIETMLRAEDFPFNPQP